MIFACGIAYSELSLPLEPAVSGMLAARRTARAGTPAVATFGRGVVATAASTVSSARAGSARGWLLRPAGEERPTDEQVLGRLVESHSAANALAVGGLTGAFLLILADANASRLAIVNDRFATCPLYYRAIAGEFSFASDPSALLGVPGAVREIDPQAIYDYVFFHCIPSPRTIYRGVSKLGPAEILHWDGKVARSELHWRPQFAATDAGTAALAPQLIERLAGAVRARVRPHTAAFLSGGLDSSTVAGMLKQASGQATTFNIGFDAPGYDESAYARIAARHFATDHHEYFVTPADVLESLPRIAAHYGEPFGNSSVIPTYQCARVAREHGVELMLAGDGGDELFAGNTRYLEQRKFEIYFRLPALLRGTLEAGYRMLPLLASLPVAGKGARYIAQARMGLPDRLQSYNFLHRFDPRGVFADGWLDGVDTMAPWQSWRARYAAPASGDALQRMLFLDWKFTLADNDLVKVNQMCELAGVDVAYPMLDEQLVDLAINTSSATLLAGSELRGFYKQACADFLPIEILRKSKHGFGLPFGMWMREDVGLRSLAREALDGLKRRSIFAPGFIDDAQRLYGQGEAVSYYGELVWILMMLELWLTEHLT